MEKILEVKNLETSFSTHLGEVKSLRGVSFDLNEGEIIGIVGESGCGKSVTMMSIMRLLAENGRIIDGEIIFNGKDISKYNEKQMDGIRGKEISMIFQDPMTSLNPVLTIGDQLTEHLIKHNKLTKAAAYARAEEMLNIVGIPDAKRRLKQHPHEFSGGMRQRVMIAMSLICNPKLVIADEPTTALDVTVQAQIIDTLKELSAKSGTSIILITHDLGIVADLCSRVNVMYGGTIIETGSDNNIFYESRHPYTRGLLSCIPKQDGNKKEKITPIEGQPPNLLDPPIGCPFAERCGYTMTICAMRQPPFFEISGGHKAACFLNHPDAKEAYASFLGKEVQI